MTEKLTPARREFYVTAARVDLGAYMALVHRTDQPEVFEGWASPQPHHERMIDALMADTLGHTLILEPREAGKTTIIQGYIEWLIGRASLAGGNWPDHLRIIYFRNRAESAEEVSDAIRSTIETSDWYHAIFPDVAMDERKWTSGSWRVRSAAKKARGQIEKDPTLRALGVGSSSIGARADRMIFDDISDHDNVKTENAREDLHRWLARTAMPFLSPRGRAIMLGTRWHWSDAPAWAMGQGWHQLLEQALVEQEDGTLVSYWPQRRSVEWLLAERERDPPSFAQNYQNEVAPEEGLFFERIWFEPRYEWLPGERFMAVDSWDTASGQGRKRSYSVGLSALVTPDFHIYITAMFRGQVPYADLREAIRLVWQRSGADWIVIEDKSTGQAALRDVWPAEIRGRLVSWQPAGQKGTKLSKDEAILQATQMCANKLVHLPSDYTARRTGGVHWLTECEQELFSYPDGQADDIVSALTQLVLFVQQYRHLAARQPRRQLQYARPSGERLAM